MKPDAWLYRASTGVQYASTSPPTAQDPDGMAEREISVFPLYTDDQLRAAQVAVLRELASTYVDDGSEYSTHKRIHRMADELEKSLPTALHEMPKRDGINAAGGTRSNPDEAADKPRTTR